MKNRKTQQRRHGRVICTAAVSFTNAKAPDRRGLCRTSRKAGLLQRVRDGDEVGGQLAAHALHGGDGRDRNAGGNQAVFDGGGAGLVLREPSNKLLHQVNSMYTWLIELTLGLSGVLSTATMALAYGATIAAQLIRLSKKGGEPGLLEQSKFGLNPFDRIQGFGLHPDLIPSPSAFDSRFPGRLRTRLSVAADQLEACGAGPALNCARSART